MFQNQSQQMHPEKNKQSVSQSKQKEKSFKKTVWFQMIVITSLYKTNDDKIKMFMILF